VARVATDRKLKLLEQDPHCHWCGRPVRHIPAPELRGQTHPDDLAVLDQTKVLACRICNEAHRKLPAIPADVNRLRAKIVALKNQIVHCRGKRRYRREWKAAEACQKIRERNGAPNLNPYHCPACGFWHLGRNRFLEIPEDSTQ
jgi:hypothetical protein